MDVYQEQTQLKDALKNIAAWSDDELKKREKAIIQVTQDKAELKDQVFQRDKEIKAYIE